MKTIISRKYNNNTKEVLTMQMIKQQSELAKLIRERRSIKKGYNNKMVKEETVTQLLEDLYLGTNTRDEAALEIYLCWRKSKA